MQVFIILDCLIAIFIISVALFLMSRTIKQTNFTDIKKGYMGLHISMLILSVIVEIGLMIVTIFFWFDASKMVHLLQVTSNVADLVKSMLD